MRVESFSFRWFGTLAGWNRVAWSYFEMFSIFRTRFQTVFYDVFLSGNFVLIMRVADDNRVQYHKNKWHACRRIGRRYIWISYVDDDRNPLRGVVRVENYLFALWTSSVARLWNRTSTSPAFKSSICLPPLRRRSFIGRPRNLYSEQLPT